MQHSRQYSQSTQLPQWTTVIFPCHHDVMPAFSNDKEEDGTCSCSVKSDIIKTNNRPCPTKQPQRENPSRWFWNNCHDFDNVFTSPLALCGRNPNYYGGIVDDDIEIQYGVKTLNLQEDYEFYRV